MENILKKAMQLFNWNDQLAQLMEECAELTVLCNHIRRGRSKPLENKKDAEDLASEIADVQIMIEQLILYYPTLQEEISSKRKEKLERLSNKIKNHQ